MSFNFIANGRVWDRAVLAYINYIAVPGYGGTHMVAKVPLGQISIV